MQNPNKYRLERKKFRIAVIGGMCSVLILFFVSMCMGRYIISLGEIARFFTGQSVSDLSRKVIVNLRIPRTLAAMLIGVALSLSGAIYQGIFNNKLVSPDLLGVSSGAGVGACFAILLGASGIWISGFSFVTGLVAVVFTILIAKVFGNRTNVILLLSGVAVGGLMSSLIGLTKYLADDDRKLAEMTYWLLGDISGTTMSDVFVLLTVVTVCGVVALLFSNQINAVSLGERDAKINGVNYRLVIGVLIVCATMMTASSVAIGGTIGWIGLAVPNIVRLAFGNDHKKVLPLSMVVGAGFMILVDALARSLAPNEIPLSVITGVLGTPLFLLSIFKRRKEIQ